MNNLNQTNGTNQDQFNSGDFALFNQIPMPIVVGYFQLYTHFLDKGVGTTQAATQAWGAVQESLPVIRTGMQSLGINIVRQAA